MDQEAPVTSQRRVRRKLQRKMKRLPKHRLRKRRKQFDNFRSAKTHFQFEF